MTSPHLTKPPACERLTDLVKAGVVLALQKSGMKYSGILKGTGVKHQPAAHIVGRAEQRAEGGSGSARKPLLDTNLDARKSSLLVASVI